jgi:hypothetical protein
MVDVNFQGFVRTKEISTKKILYFFIILVFFIFYLFVFISSCGYVLLFTFPSLFSLLIYVLFLIQLAYFSFFLFVKFTVKLGK